jgi:hypothetical protein
MISSTGVLLHSRPPSHRNARPLEGIAAPHVRNPPPFGDYGTNYHRQTRSARIPPIPVRRPALQQKTPQDPPPEGLHERELPRFIVSRATSRSRTVRMGVSAGAIRAICAGSASGAYRNASVSVPSVVFHVRTYIQPGPTARQRQCSASANRDTPSARTLWAPRDPTR